MYLWHLDGKGMLRAGENISSEPYRLYNLDVFEYEVDSTFGLYGAIPMVVAHTAERSVGAFWCASPEASHLQSNIPATNLGFR